MGNSNGKDKSEEMVDGGQLVPHGLYKGPQDWDTKSVRKFIIERKLAPFYKGLSDYDDNWDDVTLTTHNLPKNGAKELKRTGTLNSTGTNKGKEINSMKTLETQLYKGAVECPICFLYYPQNINHSRCCDQPICTECFVQIKRPENGTLGANNSPAVCPFCVEPNFGVCYKPPPFSNGIGSENVTLHTTIQNNNSSPSLSSTNTSFNTSSSDSKSRRKSVSHKDPEVVTSDQIRPDWATRVVLQPVRQPLSPRRLQNLNSPGNPRRFVPRPNNPPTGAIVPPSASTNSRRNLTPDADYSRYLAAMRMGTDLEELMVMEAIRLSLVEQEVAQRREREERDRSNNNSQESSNTISSQNEENETNNIRVNDIDDGNDDDGDDDDDDDDDGLLTPRRLGLNGDEDDEDEGEEDLTSHSLENTSTIVSTPITTGTEDETITSTSAQSSPVSTNSINDHQQINTSLSLPLPPPPPPPLASSSSSSPSSATTTATATATDSITVTETEIGTITETTAETTTTKPVATTTSINAHNVDNDNDNVTTTTIIEEIRLINRNDDQEISPPPPLITTSENDG